MSTFAGIMLVVLSGIIGWLMDLSGSVVARAPYWGLGAICGFIGATIVWWPYIQQASK